MNSSPPSVACMCQNVSIVSGNGLLPFQHQAISSVPEPCWLNINWTLRNNPVKIISPCYLIHLFITVHKTWIGIERKWIELELNWKILNLIWIGIELNWKILNPTWIGIELNWKKWIDPSPDQIVGFLIGSVPKPCLVAAPTTVKLPHASGHSSGNRQGHVTKTKTHRFEIFVAFRVTNV